MRNKRKHSRFKLNVIELSSSMSVIGKVDVVDMSEGGVALKLDKKLNIGKDCLMMLGYRGKNINVKGSVVRCELSGVEEKAEGIQTTVYSAGVVFKAESAGAVKEFLDAIEQSSKAQVAEPAGWYFRDIKFSITTPSEAVLNLQSHFGVKEISQSGIIIQTDHALKVDSMVLIELTLQAAEPSSFMGRVVSCRKMQDRANASYDVGVEFAELTDQDRTMLISFIDIVKDRGGTVH